MVSPIAAMHGGAAAQTRAERNALSASAAIEEVRRGPFHTTWAQRAPIALEPAALARTHPPREAFGNPATDSLLFFGRVFWPTLAATYAADLVGFWALKCHVYEEGRGCIGSGPVNLAIVAAFPALIPALAASRLKTPFLPALAGSALGTGAALLGVRLIGRDNLVVVLLPLIHAALTTAVGIDMTKPPPGRPVWLPSAVVPGPRRGYC